MAPSKTSTVKNKHAGKRSANGSGISNSKYSTRPQNDGVVKKKAPPKTAKGTNKPRIKKRRVYTEKELGIPQLNMITPVGVEKPKMGKKGKVFVDDRVCYLAPGGLDARGRLLTLTGIHAYDPGDGACG